MFVPSATDAIASTHSPALNVAPSSEEGSTEPIRHMLFGSPGAVRSTIRLLYRLNYAEPNDWSQPIPTGRTNEVMAVLTKRTKSNS